MDLGPPIKGKNFFKGLVKRIFKMGFCLQEPEKEFPFGVQGFPADPSGIEASIITLGGFNMKFQNRIIIHSSTFILGFLSVVHDK